MRSSRLQRQIPAENALERLMGLPEDQCEMLRECAPLHDVGKIGIPDEILLKPGMLNEKEREVMCRHCLYGCEILGPMSTGDGIPKSCSDPERVQTDRGDNELLRLARTLAAFHHERWDGK